MRITRIVAVLSLLAVGLFFLSAVAAARVERPITLSFNPEKGTYNRYMTVVTLGGAITRPGQLTSIDMSDFRIRAVYRDRVEESLHGLNRHLLTFYDYDLWAQSPRERRDRTRGPGAGGGGGTGGGGASAQPPSLGIPSPPSNGAGAGGSTLQQGPSGPGSPGGPGAPGGPSRPSHPGETEPTFSVDNILVTNLSYTESKNGDVLEVEGLDQLREYSRHSVRPGEIRLDIGHIFDWTHILRLPDYPVWREDIWFATMPIAVPGVPKPQMMKFIYQVIGFVRVGMRQIAVIDAQGVLNFHEYWEEDDPKEDTHVNYEAMGDFSISARYLFDYQQGMVFGIERPPLIDFDTLSMFPGEFPLRVYELKYPGLVANLNMKYYTETTAKRLERRYYSEEETGEVGQEEPVLDRRHVGLTFFMQTEAE